MIKDNNVRILQLRASRFLGGPEKQILHHAVAVRSAKREIWIGSFRDGPVRTGFLQRAEEMGLPTLELGSGRFDPRTILELARKLRQKKISLICTHGYKANLIGWAASRLARCAHVAFARGWTGENWRIKLYDSLDRLVLRWTEWVVCVSQAQADQLQKKQKGHRAPLVISNAALFLAEDVLLPIDRLPIRRTLGLCEEAFLVCMVGRLSVEKGHRYLLDAIPHLIERIPKLQVLVLGEGAERRRLEEEVARIGVQNFVAFAGFQSDVKPWMQACDVLVSPSLTEGMPNVILEAMAFGTPVVATRVGGVPELLQYGETGILVPPADTPTLANAIYDLFANPAQALRLACKAQIGVQDYSPAKQDQRLLDLYARALQVPRQELADNSAILPTQG